MKYSKKELHLIQKKRPDLIRKPEPSTNTAIVAFLRKYNEGLQIPMDFTSQEWMSLRQKTLDNKDFPKFQIEHFNEVIEHNQKIDQLLEDPRTQKELDFLIKKYTIHERIRQYQNPLYFYSKNQNNQKVRKDRKLYRVYKSFWILLIFAPIIFLIIFSFQK